MTYPIRQVFSPSLLNDYERLKQYLHGEQDLAAIQAQSEHQQLEEYSPPGLGRVIFKGFLKSPLVLLTTPDSFVIYLLNKIGLRSIASLVHVASHHVFKEGSDYTMSRWCKSPILIPGRNYPKMEVSDVYMCPDIPSSQITDPRIRLRTQVQMAVGSDIDLYQYAFHMKILLVCLRKGYVLQIPIVFLRTVTSLVQAMGRLILEKGCGYIAYSRDFRQIFDRLKKTYSWALMEEPFARSYGIFESFHTECPMPDPVRVYKGEGVCRGAAEYFIHLCIQSRKWFNTPEEWLKAVSNQFRDGVPGQGVLMQALYNIPSCFFGYSVTRLDNHLISSGELDARSETAIEKIKALPPGVYFTGVYKHGLVYIKLCDGSSYTWNSDFGLLKQTAGQLLDHVIEWYHKTGQKNSDITFSRHRVFRWHPFSFLNRSII